MNEIICIDKDVAKKLGIELIYMFGSVLKDRDYSRDIDIGIFFSKDVSCGLYFNYAARFKIFLEKGNLLRKKIDITILNLASSLLRYEVVIGGAVLFMKDELTRDNFELKVYKEYNDYIYRERFYDEALTQRIRKGV